jgi:CRISPR-associated protein Cmr2
MPAYLLTLSLGPVQSLIGAARRTRDLWCGSWLLSEAARAAARVLHEAQPGCLIFPCPDNPDVDLAPCDGPGAVGDEGNVANIIRATMTLPDGDAVGELAGRARDAAVARLRDMGEQARGRLDQALREDIWQVQIDDLLESFAAWVELSADAGDYGAASERLGGLLAARKASRDFAPAPLLDGAPLPKSSLDGARETVLPKWPEGHSARLKLGLSDNEQLDALGVIKRMAVNAEQFTAYARIAADPWLAALSADDRARLRDEYQPLVRLGLATGARGNADTYQVFPFDAQLLFDFRLRNAEAQNRKALEDSNLQPPEQERQTALRDALSRLRAVLRQVGRGDAPVPYAVILKADGDRMGKLLAAAGTVEQARLISRALHAFASEVRRLVREQRGHAVYAGGDDVLALVPLASALSCAESLAEAFKRHLHPIAADLHVASADLPTLSVGLGIGHLMEPLGALRARADEAEHRAKGSGRGDERNALAIVLGVRSGAEHHWRAQWSAADAHAALASFSAAFRCGALPSRVAFDLGASDRRLAWLRDDTSATAGAMRQAEVQRVLDRARAEGGTKSLDRATRALLCDRAAVQPLAELAETLVIARWLAARTAGDVGEAR